MFSAKKYRGRETILWSFFILHLFSFISATLEMKNKYADRPCITMSMGSLGVISRLSGEIFGSCMTFAAARKVSAPGQINVTDARNILKLLRQKS